ncbi:transporter [Candidimonas nitroreducens]|uniref:Transporter n=1 Tax=Candidimonas nitroreducens TaxID=683354 RepID=A0A225MZD0_9BURK|nr:transporter [Candidimonas nitroreducens]
MRGSYEPRWLRRALLAGLCALPLLSGCASYQSQPLPDRAGGLSRAQLAHIRVDRREMPLPELAAHRFDPSNGLDIEEVAMLAVVGNPALRLARDDLKVARAQSFAAGLLPDPQLGFSNDFPGAASATSSAFSAGLSMDLMALLRRGTTKSAANAETAKIDLGLLWQEWQTIAQARQLFIKTRFQTDTLPLLERQSDLAEARYAHMAKALRQGNLTGDALTAALLAQTDARKQYTDAQRAALQTRHALNALLGLQPDVALHLTGDGGQVPLDDKTVEHSLAGLPARRPDLLALRAGYVAQDQKYRAAILDQFPSLSVGFVRARDTSSVYTSGFQISLNLPIFNRNRGNIAIEKASRRRLRDEYQNRLDQAYAEVAQLREDSALLERQLTEVEAALPGMAAQATAAARAYASHDLGMNAYVDAQSGEIAKRIEAASLRESIAEQRVGMQALLGGAIPDAFSSDVELIRAHEH